MITVAVLCAARNSVYHGMAGVEVYDSDRDAKTFLGGMPVMLRYEAEPTFCGFLILLSRLLASTSDRECSGQRPSIKAPDT